MVDEFDFFELIGSVWLPEAKIPNEQDGLVVAM